MISPFDLILTLIIFSFVMFGLWFGFVHAVGGVVGTVVGAVVASRYFERFAETNLGRVIAFVVLFAIASRLTGFLFYGIEKIVKVTHIIPGLKTIDRLVGGILGLVEGTIVIGAALFFAAKFPVGALNDFVIKSELAQFLIKVGAVVVPLFPKAVKEIQEASNALP